MFSKKYYIFTILAPGTEWKLFNIFVWIMFSDVITLHRYCNISTSFFFFWNRNFWTYLVNYSFLIIIAMFCVLIFCRVLYHNHQVYHFLTFTAIFADSILFDIPLFGLKSDRSINISFMNPIRNIIRLILSSKGKFSYVFT